MRTWLGSSRVQNAPRLFLARAVGYALRYAMLSTLDLRGPSLRAMKSVALSCTVYEPARERCALARGSTRFKYM